MWTYVAPHGTEIHTTWPLGKDRVLIMQNGNPAKLMPIRKATGKVEKELVLETRDATNVHARFRHIRMTRAGTFLVAHMDLGKIVEYSADGKKIWSVAAPLAWAAVRLANGNTLIDNWAGSLPVEDWPKAVQLIEVIPGKQVVCVLRDWKTLGPASSTRVLDEPGVPEDADLQP